MLILDKQSSQKYNIDSILNSILSMLYFGIYTSALTLQAVSATLVTDLNTHCLMKPKITFQNIKLHLYQSSPVQSSA